MMRDLAYAACCVAATVAAADRTLSPTVNHYAMSYQWGSPWGGILDAILGGSVRLDAASSQPRGFVSRLYDGDAGSLHDPTGTFLVFDDSRAAIRVSVPAWREVGTLAFYALEAAHSSRAKLRVSFEQKGAAPRDVEMTRRVISQKGGMAHVEYRAAPTSAFRDGELALAYENADFGSAFVSEVTLDDLAAIRPAPPRAASSALLFWQQSKASKATLHSLIFRTARTGKKEADVTPAWLAVPAGARDRRVPLVILVGEPGVPHSALELLGLAGRSEWAIAPALVEAGIAVLVVDLPTGQARDYASRLRTALSETMDGTFARFSHVAVDPHRLGIWGWGSAAAIARDVASDERFRLEAPSPERAGATPDSRAVVEHFSKVLVAGSASGR